ncbi:non-homologous end-joining DNA ligase [Fulvivirgaceae bacterium PWU4]|uniref:DNA ligase (ATP) n=1 Tax=Chryseosolibacter histidini TaxID=2782349 RepID=A0AAP2DR95_9BACT|nr:non-homologous end-joining DNA ligase [Chryseosolibacter histidini]MBT1699552.1 non-homologous end-joining DNA ligase [Chryseosolibacter histidini]
MKYVKIEGSRKLSSFIVPMMAQLSDRPAFDNPDWLFEVKWDGYRAIGEINETENRLYSRNGLTYNKAYPKVFEALKSIPINAIIDGEIVVLDEKGRPNFQKLQNYTNNDKHVIQYHVFDCLEIDGKSITQLPLVNRKELLRELLPESAVIKYCDHVDGEGKVLFREMQKTHFEGMIAKRKQSKYLIGKRSSDWLKIKNIQTMEAVVVGFTDPKGSRKHFGSLLLGAFKKGKLVFIGGVGTGFTDQSLTDVYAKLKPLIRKSSPLHVPIKQTPDMTWVDPLLVCNIAYAEITDDGSVRHAVFQGLRVDKAPEDVRI